jgi:tetratricopeptide (TPR) repeat protein
MKLGSISLAAALLLLAVSASLLAQGEKGQGNVSADEQKMAQAIVAAPDAAGKIRAGSNLIKKYPKSTMRARVAGGLVYEISKVPDPSQKISLAQSFQAAFTEPSEQALILPLLLRALADAKRPDEAFSTAAAFLSKHPDSVPVLVQIALIGAEQARAENAKFVSDSLQYADHAKQLIESDKRPADMDDADWGRYKTQVLPNLYQTIGLFYLVKGDKVQAKANYTKATQLAPAEPVGWVILAGIVNDEYQTEATHYQSMPNGSAKQEERTKVESLMDAAIVAYAHAIALSEGNVALQAARQQYLQDMEVYYKYRHHSTEGMQALIDKYKLTTKP